MNGISTRFLLTCAVIGVVGGLLLIPLVNVFSPAVVAGIPYIYVLTLGLWALPGILGQSLLRRGGVAMLVYLVAGIVAGPFSPYGFSVIIENLIIGAIMELPFLVRRYRDWRPWLFYLTGALTAFIMGLFGFALIVSGVAVAWLQVVALVLPVVSGLVVTRITRMVAAAVVRTGAVRGLQGPEVRHAEPSGAQPPASAKEPETG